MKKVILFFAFIFSFVFVSGVFAEVKVGVFDMQEVMVKSKEGNSIKAKLDKKKEFYTNEIKAKENELKAMKDDIEKKGMMLSAEAKEAQEKDYQKKIRDLKLYAQDSENDLKNIYREETQKLIHQIIETVKSYAAKGNYSVVFEKNESGAVYFDKANDITEAVLKNFNEASAAAPAATAPAKNKGKK